MALLDSKLGPHWGTHFSEEGTWTRVLSLDDHQLWHAHPEAQERAHASSCARKPRPAFADRSHEAAQLVGSGLLLDTDA
jgi:hypothetical protein